MPEAEPGGSRGTSSVRAALTCVRFVCKELDHPEGICLTADGQLVAGGEHGQIYRIDPETGTATTIASTEGFVLGVCADASGNVYACDAGRNEVLRIAPDGEVRSLTSCPLDNPNDCALDEEGNLFFSESGNYYPGKPGGRLHVVTKEGECRCIHPGPLRFANGVYLHKHTSMLYVVESTEPSVLAFEVDGPNLASTTPRRRIELDPGTVPDGVAMDTDGSLYVAFYSPDQIGVVRPDGSFDVLCRDIYAEWMNRPTNLVLRENEIVFANLGGWHIGAIHHDLTPVPPCFPASGPAPA